VAERKKKNKKLYRKNKERNLNKKKKNKKEKKKKKKKRIHQPIMQTRLVASIPLLNAKNDKQNCFYHFPLMHGKDQIPCRDYFPLGNIS